MYSMFIHCSELTEDSGQDPIVEGVTFYVRYLGSCFVINKAGDETTSEAIKSIVSMVSGIYLRYYSIAASKVRQRLPTLNSIYLFDISCTST